MNSPILIQVAVGDLEDSGQDILGSQGFGGLWAAHFGVPGMRGGLGRHRTPPHLPDDALDAGQGQPLVVGFDDPAQQLVPQHLQHHANIWAGGAVKEPPNPWDPPPPPPRCMELGVAPQDPPPKGYGHR